VDSVEFDPRKNASNLAKHGVDLAMAGQIWEDYVVERVDDRLDYGEIRFIALGAVEGRTLVVVYTWRGARRRLISARKANGNERKIYAAARARLASEEG
jgi:uncharacterized DUF497 family protein